MSVCCPPAWQWRLFLLVLQLTRCFPNASPGFSLYQLTDMRGNSWLEIKLSGLQKFSLVFGDLEFWVQIGSDPTMCVCKILREDEVISAPGPPHGSGVPASLQPKAGEKTQMSPASSGNPETSLFFPHEAVMHFGKHQLT